MHVEIASKINKIIDDKDLTDLGKLEQDLVFGDATSKEIITYISTNQKMSAADKVRACSQCTTPCLLRLELLIHIDVAYATRQSSICTCICGSASMCREPHMVPTLQSSAGYNISLKSTCGHAS